MSRSFLFMYCGRRSHGWTYLLICIKTFCGFATYGPDIWLDLWCCEVMIGSICELDLFWLKIFESKLTSAIGGKTPYKPAAEDTSLAGKIILLPS